MYNETYLLTHSTVQCPSWAADWFAASQEIPRVSRNPKVHYRTHKRTPPVPILGQPNPVHLPISRSILILSTHLRLGLTVVSFPPVSPPRPYTRPSPHPYAPHAQPVSFFLILSPARYCVRSTKHLSLRYAVSSSPPLPRPDQQYCFILSHKRGDLKKKLLKMKCVPSFSATFVWNISHSMKKWARYDNKCIVVYVTYPLFLSDFNATWTSLTDIRKILRYQISWKTVQWKSTCSMWTDGRTNRRTDITKLIVPFHNFSNAPKNWCTWIWTSEAFHRTKKLRSVNAQTCPHPERRSKPEHQFSGNSTACDP